MNVIRLKKVGTKNLKKWRVIVTDRTAPRNGRLLEELGSYNSLVNPPEIRIRLDQYETWVKNGAKPSATVANLVKEQKKSKA